MDESSGSESQEDFTRKNQVKKQGGMMSLLGLLIPFRRQVQDAENIRDGSDAEEKSEEAEEDKKEQQYEEEVIKAEIEKHWDIIEHVSSEEAQNSESQSVKESEQEEDEDDEQEEEEQSEKVNYLKAQVESLYLQLERSECENVLLQDENKLMRQQIEEWLKNPDKKYHRYARTHGVLAFDEVCDEVKMERQSNIGKKIEEKKE